MRILPDRHSFLVYAGLGMLMLLSMGAVTYAQDFEVMEQNQGAPTKPRTVPLAQRPPQEIRAEAEKNNPYAQLIYGLYSLYGVKGVPKSDVEAYSWLSKSAEAGNPHAKFYVAWMMFEQRGTADPRDPKRILELLKDAADAKNADAQLMLGQFYEFGYGVEMNLDTALMLYCAAFLNGNQRALPHRDKIARVLGDERFEAAQTAARNLVRRPPEPKPSTSTTPTPENKADTFL